RRHLQRAAECGGPHAAPGACQRADPGLRGWATGAGEHDSHAGRQARGESSLSSTGPASLNSVNLAFDTLMTEPLITPELVQKHNLTPEEYDKLKAVLGREPTYTELGIFSVMWSEHCSYKNT